MPQHRGQTLNSITKPYANRLYVHRRPPLRFKPHLSPSPLANFRCRPTPPAFFLQLASPLRIPAAGRRPPHIALGLLVIMRIRRMGRLLGLCGGTCSTSVETSSPPKNPVAEENPNQNVKSVCVHPMATADLILPNQEEFRLIEKEQENIAGDDQETDTPEPDEMKESVQQYPVSKVRPRKQHKRRQREEREVSLKGVYYKNMKWQAAIKVDKKQIHLGTVRSQKEAAHLYDRAAFMCGREPNFLLSEEEKQELSKLTWKEFLARTRNDIASKRHLRRVGAAAQVNAAPKSPANWEDDEQVAEAFSTSDFMYED